MSAALSTTELHKRFGQIGVLHGVDLTVHQGEVHAIIGPNGAGKSTLFNVISGRTSPSGGRVFLSGDDVTGAPAHSIARMGLARNFQISNVFLNLNVYENLRLAAQWATGCGVDFSRRISERGSTNRRADQLLDMFSLTKQAKLLASSLAYSDQRALELGMALASEPQVLLLDEPTAGMSHTETERVVEVIRRVSQGRTIIMIEHDMAVVFGLATRVSVLVQGRIIATDTPKQIRANSQVQEAYLGSSVSNVPGA